MKTLQEYYEEGQFTAFGDLIIFPNGRVLIESPFGFLSLSNNDCGKVLTKLSQNNANFEGVYDCGNLIVGIDKDNYATAYLDKRGLLKAEF